MMIIVGGDAVDDAIMIVTTSDAMTDKKKGNWLYHVYRVYDGTLLPLRSSPTKAGCTRQVYGATATISADRL